jgi:PAS domain S-box-containing protein
VLVDWFEGRGHEAISDFWAAYDRATLEGTGVLFESTAAREARKGDWRAYEDRLASLATDYANRGVEVEVWGGLANDFHAQILPILVESLGSNRERLVAALAVLGELTTRSLAFVAQHYIVRKQRIHRALEARHAQLLDATPDPVIGIDASGRVTAFNAAAEQTFGYTAGATIGVALAELVIPARFREQHVRGLTRVVAGEHSHILGRRTEMVAMRANGSELPVELTIVATPDSDGRPAFTGFLRDLTAHRHGEESSALWSHALEQAAFGIVVSDRVSRTITRANPAYAQMLGYQPEELIGIAGERLIAPSTLVQISDVAATLRARRHHTYELDLLRKDGVVVPVLASSSPVETHSGARLLVSTVIDIGDRVQLEQERARAMARLASVSAVGHELAGATSDLGAILDLVARRVAENVVDLLSRRSRSASLRG